MPTFSSSGTYEHADNWNKWLGKFKGVKCQGLEVGCYEGRGTLWFIENICTHPDSTMSVVDWFKGGDEHRAAGLNCNTRALFDDNLRPHNLAGTRKLSDVIDEKSDKGLRILLEAADISDEFRYDFIYIDGSHNACDVLSDAVLCWPLLRAGGILIFDDFLWRFQGPLTEPMMAIDAFLRCYEGKYKLLFKGWQVALEKIV
jgi:Methyltransferase domain